jgi:hypothetical protein
MCNLSNEMFGLNHKNRLLNAYTKAKFDVKQLLIQYLESFYFPNTYQTIRYVPCK